MSCSMIDIVGSLDFWRSCRMISCLYTFVRGSIAYYPFAHKCDASTIIGPRRLKVHWHCLALPILLYKVFGPIGLQPERRQFFSHLFATSVLGIRRSSQGTACTFWRRGVWPLTGSAIPIVEEDLFSVVWFWEKLKEAGTASPTSLFSALRQRDKSTIDKPIQRCFFIKVNFENCFFSQKGGRGQSAFSIRKIFCYRVCIWMQSSPA